MVQVVLLSFISKNKEVHENVLCKSHLARCFFMIVEGKQVATLRHAVIIIRDTSSDA